MWGEGVAEFGEGAGGESSVSEAVVGAFESDDAGLVGFVEGGFECGFDGFEAGVGEDGFGGPEVPAFKGEGAEFFAEVGFEGRGVDVAHGVEEGLGLAGGGFDDGGVVVAEAGDAEGAGEVEEAIVVGVPDVDALTAFPEDGEVVTEEGDVLGFVGAEGLGEFAGAGAGDGGIYFGEHGWVSRILPRWAGVD